MFPLLDRNLGQWDCFIEDNIFETGILLSGQKENVETVTNELVEQINGIRIDNPLSVGNIYLGKVTSTNNDSVWVNIGSAIVEIPKKFQKSGLIEGEKTIVQIIELKQNPLKIIGSMGIQIQTKYFCLVDDDIITCHDSINPEKKDLLIQVGKDCKPDPWGVHFFEQASYAPITIIEQQLLNMQDTIAVLSKDILEFDKIGLVHSTIYCAEILLHYGAKTQLTEISNHKLPYYVYFLSQGRDVSFCLDFIEKMNIDPIAASTVLFNMIVKKIKPNQTINLVLTSIENNRDSYSCVVKDFNGKVFSLIAGKGEMKIFESELGSHILVELTYNQEGTILDKKYHITSPLEIIKGQLHAIKLVTIMEKDKNTISEGKEILDKYLENKTINETLHSKSSKSLSYISSLM